MDLPAVLIGPVLRRVEPDAVSVYIATRAAANVRVAVYDGQVDATAPPPELASATAATTRFASAFHAVVVTVPFAGAAALQPGHLYSYDVRVTLADGGGPQSLLDLGLLADSTLPGYKATPPPPAPPKPPSFDVEVVSLGYGENTLPSFVTCPVDLEDLVLAHASCRKPHGDGNPALRHLDALLEDLDGSADGRPHMLFLTGDQIYADDVASALLPGLSALGIQLLGGEEKVPSPIGTADLIVNMTALPAGFRQKITPSAGFTSDYASSHLIGFGEFLAMYCAAWNPQLWPVLAVADRQPSPNQEDLPERQRRRLEKQRLRLEDDARHAPAAAPVVLGKPSGDARDDVISPLFATSRQAVDALEEARNEFLAAKALLDDYRREVPRVRRLLANVPTYMICDDHEITDDWFLTGKVRSDNTANPFGRALLRNALAAFTVCQAWGNDPKRWTADTEERKLLTGVAGMFPAGWNGGLPRSAGADAVDTELGLAPGAEPLGDFSFSVDGPKHRVRVLDTRMRRQFDGPKAAPGLLTAAALDHQLPEEDLPAGHLLVVVSPAPVFGPPILSEIGGAIAASVYDVASMARSETDKARLRDLTGLPDGGKVTGRQYFDAEHWGIHPAAFERLLERLSHYARVVVLGGDVHYGAAYEMDWTGDGRTSRIVHFTSSAARNDWKASAASLGGQGTVHNLMAFNGMAAGLQQIGLPLLRLGWDETLPPVVSGLEEEPPLTRIRVQTAPVLLSDEMFRAAHPLERPPDWVWRARQVFDERPSAARPEAAQVPEPATDLPDDGTAVNRYAEVMAVHQRGLRTAAVMRGLQFTNNVGVITFAVEADGIHVSQALHSLRPNPEPNEPPGAYIVHETRLEPDPVPVPTSVGTGA